MIERRPRNRLALWLATLALGLNLLAPGLCLAQMLASAPLGAICSAVPSEGIGPQSSWPGDATDLHKLKHCGHCAVPAVSIADTSSPPSWLVLSAEVPRLVATPAPVAAPSLWRPPPRGPPLSA
jgi:hypothetical protein